MMKAIVKKIGSDFFVEYSAPSAIDPTMIISRWKIVEASTSGNRAFAPELAEGLEVTYILNSISGWQAYQQGGWLQIRTLEKSEAPELRPIPCPRVRKGTETRWANCQWEKYSRQKGWIPA